MNSNGNRERGNPELDQLEQRAINTIRGLAMDAPLVANSGHQGTAMALAPLAHVLWTRVMRYDPSAPHWPDRDRFVLSAGHASILLYSMLYLTGYGLTLQDLRDFRQWGSLTPGHPETGHTPGVEVTTGPLGQGFANGVGMGIAEQWLRNKFSPHVVDHHTYVICSDGDLMEGISHEAASLAGHLGLGRLVYIYDDNRITIDGSTDLAYSDDAARRFESYGWDVLSLGDVANDLDHLEAALMHARAVEDKPSLLVLRTHVAWPSPNFTDNPKAHGNALDADEVARTKERLGIPPEEMFWVPDDVLEHYRAAGRRGSEAREAWEKVLASWDGDRAALDACLAGAGLPGWQDVLPTWDESAGPMATRKASKACLDALAPYVPGLLAGGADLTDNTGTVLTDQDAFSSRKADGRQLYFGVREHAMGGILNGMALHGGTLPVGGTFFVFSDYMRPAVRMASISQAKVVFVWTHDSVGVGEDGPTHQPIEQLASLRAMPGLRVIRPADANEVAVAWRVAIEAPGPVALILTRQSVPVLEGTVGAPLERGAYVLRQVPEPDVVLVGTGSEVQVCVDAAELLSREGLAAQVVSMPCWELFALQPDDYQDTVLPPTVATLAVEAGASFGWDRWVDDTVSIDRFGASAPGGEALARFGFTPENVADRARQLLDDLDDI